MNTISRYITIGLSVLAAVFLIYTFSDIVMYVIISWVLSMLGQPPMRIFRTYLRIGRFRAGKNVSAVLVLLCFIIVLLSVLLLFVPLVIQEANALASLDYNAIGKSLESPFQQVNEWLVQYGIITESRPPQEMVKNALMAILNSSSISSFFGSSLSVVSNLLVGFFSILFITFFFLKEPGLFFNFMVALVPAQYEQQMRDVLNDISTMLTRYFGGVALQIFLIAVYVSIFLSILGVKNAILIGFFAALMNLIPYLGPALGGGIGILIAVSANLDADFTTVILPMTIKVLVVFWTVQMLDNYFLTPYIFSTTVLAHPLEIFIAILVGAKVGGVLGMVLAIPAYTVLRVVAREFLSRFKIVKRITGRLEEAIPEDDKKK